MGLLVEPMPGVYVTVFGVMSIVYGYGVPARLRSMVRTRQEVAMETARLLWKGQPEWLVMKKKVVEGQGVTLTVKLYRSTEIEKSVELFFPKRHFDYQQAVEAVVGFSSVKFSGTNVFIDYLPKNNVTTYVNMFKA